MQLKLRKTSKTGYSAYEAEGVRGSLYMTRSLYKGEPPETIEVSGFEFSEANAGSATRSPGAGRAPNPERVAKVQAQAAKAAERAAKAQERAEKLLARVAAAGVATEEAVPEPVVQ